MARPIIRRGRYVTAALVGLTLAVVISLHLDRPLSNVAAAEGGQDNPQAGDADTLDIGALQSKFQALARQVAPAVVSISAAQTASDCDATQRSQEMNPQRLEEVLAKTTRTIGTGFIVDEDGFILTNEHVIEDSQQYWVTTDDHKVYPAIVVGADPRADLAVLKIPAGHLPTAHFALAPCQRGQWAVTLGNPYGLATEGEMALSVGIISATDRALPRLASKEDRLYTNLIQTTAQINPGNSGGPLLDVDGQVIGIDTAVILPQKQTNGIGFAIPITPRLLQEVRDLQQGREVVYGYLGVTVTAPTPRQLTEAGLQDQTGVCVEAIEPGSPAAGPEALAIGDLVVQVNGAAVTDTDRFVRLIGDASVDRPVELSLKRGGQSLVVRMTPIKRSIPCAVWSRNQRMYWRGMELGPVPANWPAAQKNPRAGGILVMGIDQDSPLKRQGVSAGAVITSIGGQPVKSLLDLQRILNDVPPEKCDVRLADQVIAAQK